MSEPLLELRGVTRRFGGTVAVDDLTLALRAGELTSLIGPNGAGKSSLVDLLAGRSTPDAGEVRYEGRRLPAGAHRAARLGIGRLFQEVRVFPSLTVLENVAAAVPGQAGEGVWSSLLAPRRLRAEAAGVAAAAREQLAFVGLADRAESLAGSLSYGQQKLVAIARLLAGGARLLLLDEPASGVNPEGVRRQAGLLRELVATGRTVLLVEHNLALVREVSDRVVLLDRGRCRADGPPAEVFAGEALREVYLPGAAAGSG